MLDVRRLRLLRELEIHGSLVAVATALGISTSAVSQQLAKLEADVGVAVLERLGRNVQLTPTGRMLAGRVREIDAILEEAAADLDERRTSVQGVVRFAAFSTYALRRLPTLTARLAQRHPDVVVEFTHVEPTEAIAAVAGRRADVAVTDEYPGLPRESGAQLTRTHLFRDPISVAVPRPAGTIEELAALPWVLEPWGSDARDWATQRCRAAGFEPIVQFESPDLRLHADLVAAGVAAAFLPESLQQRHEPPKRIFPAEAGFAEGLYRDVFAVTRRGAHTRLAVAAFLEELQAIESE